MKKILFVNDVKKLSSIVSGYRHIYLGNEFCPRLFFDFNDIKKIKKFSSDNKIKISFVTSYSEHKSIIKIKKIFNSLDKLDLLAEVIVNDLGVLNLLNKYFHRTDIVIGRALSRYIYLDKNNYYYNMGIRRIEYDHICKVPGAKKEIKYSLYYPYSVVSATRYCPVIGLEENSNFNHGILNCIKDCQKYKPFKITNKLTIGDLYLLGNCILYRNKINIIKGKNIDRFIYCPYI
ncbi:MAG: hypothetical protein WC197_00165 [Candidatus Gastranaerophilaceae bacterium]|jgi:hypothetical protein